MCFLTSVYKIKEDESLLPAIAKMMFEEQDSNDDGTGAYCFNKEGNLTYEGRTQKEDYFTILENLKKFDVVNYHFRNGTGGESGQHNIHFWKIGKWLFAHNGIASTFGNAKDCDSLDIFKKLTSKHFIGQNGYINIKKIKKFINASNFTGRFVIINSENRKTYFFGDWHVYLINRSYLVVASSISSFENKETIKALGITFETEKEIELEVLESNMDGIIVFSFKDGFKQLDEKFKDWDYKGYNGYNPVKTEEQNAKEEQDKKIEEYYAKSEDVDEYFGSNEYQEELARIDAKLDTITKEIGSDYTNDNLLKLENAEIERDIAVEALDDKFFGLKVPNKQLALCG